MRTVYLLVADNDETYHEIATFATRQLAEVVRQRQVTAQLAVAAALSDPDEREEAMGLPNFEVHEVEVRHSVIPFDDAWCRAQWDDHGIWTPP